MSAGDKTTEEMKPVEILPYLHSVFGKRLLDYYTDELAKQIDREIMEIPIEKMMRPKDE